MNALKNGITLTAKVLELGRDFMLVDYCGKVHRIDFELYPYFKSCFVSELYNVEASAVGLHWPDADIDIEVEYLEHPPRNPSMVSVEWWNEQRRRQMSRLGAAGGSVRTPRKSAASRANGAKGGRPKKKPEPSLA